jgi:hypothetical protein
MVSLDVIGFLLIYAKYWIKRWESKLIPHDIIPKHWFFDSSKHRSLYIFTTFIIGSSFFIRWVFTRLSENYYDRSELFDNEISSIYICALYPLLFIDSWFY